MTGVLAGRLRNGILAVGVLAAAEAVRRVAGSDRRSRGRPDVRLERAVDAYLRHISIERGLSDHTVAAYRRDLAGYVDWLTERGIARLERRDGRARHRRSPPSGPPPSRRPRHPASPAAVLGAGPAPLPRARGHRDRRSRPGGCARRRPPGGCPKALTIDQVERRRLTAAPVINRVVLPS